MSYIDATKTLACIRLYLLSDRNFWIASDIATGAIYGRFDGGWFA